MVNSRTAAIANKLKTGPGSNADFTWGDGDDAITVPSLAIAPTPGPIEYAEALATGGIQGEAMGFVMLLKAAAGDQYPVIKTLSSADQKAFLEAWAEHSGVGLGESKAS